MKTNVQSTSIAAYHGLETKAAQIEKIARFIIAETKAARWAWIGKVARHFNMEKSTVSARMAELKAMTERGEAIRIDGRDYEMRLIQKVFDQVTAVTVQAWGLLLKPAPVGVQTELFQ